MCYIQTACMHAFVVIEFYINGVSRQLHQKHIVHCLSNSCYFDTINIWATHFGFSNTKENWLVFALLSFHWRITSCIWYITTLYLVECSMKSATNDSIFKWQTIQPHYGSLNAHSAFCGVKPFLWFGKFSFFHSVSCITCLIHASQTTTIITS